MNFQDFWLCWKRNGESSTPDSNFGSWQSSGYGSPSHSYRRKSSLSCWTIPERSVSNKYTKESAIISPIYFYLLWHWNTCLRYYSTHKTLELILFIYSRVEGSGKIRYAESSMRNGFGLKYLHMFFNLPFLQLQVFICN